MNQKQQIDQYCCQYKITGISAKIDQTVKTAEKKQLSYLSFLMELFENECQHREQQAKEKYLKLHIYPQNPVDQCEIRDQNGLSSQKINTVKEMDWLEQIYNIMLLGPSGVGRTFLAAGLCAQGIEKGCKAYFRTIEDILNMLRMKEFARSAMADYKRLAKENLNVIDDNYAFSGGKGTGY